MGLEIPTLMAIMAGTSAVSAASSVASSAKARREAKKKANEGKEAAEQLDRETERNRLQAAMRLSRGRGKTTDPTKPRSTILTSPLGLTGAPTGGGKTLLGL